MRAEGFTLVEAVIAMALSLVVTVSSLALLAPSQGTAQIHAEAIDMQQRLRFVVDVLTRDLVMAGAGPDAGPGAGPLVTSFAPIIPRKTGVTGDAFGVARPDAITMTYVPPTLAQTTLTSAVPPTTGVTVSSPANCVAAAAACGLQAGMTAVIFDRTAQHEIFTITSAPAGSLQLQRHAAVSTHVFSPGANIAQVESRSFYLDEQRNQLRQYDGLASDQPVVDNVVGLAFEYLGDPAPPSAPVPPAGVENCLYDGAGHLTPLPFLAPPGGALVPLPLASLSDGPWCGEGSSQFDADLLRVRSVRVSVRVQAGAPEFRGSGPSFARAGTSRDGRRYLPDVIATFRVWPRNMNLNR